MISIAVGGLVFGLLARVLNQYLFMPPTAPTRLLYGFGVMILFVGLRNIRDLMSIGLIVMLLLFAVLGARRWAARRRQRGMAAA